MPKSRLYVATLLPLLCVLLTLAFPVESHARFAWAFFVDDDWDPVWRGERTYTSDPGYEFWIQEALDLTNIPYDVFEVQVDATSPANVPTLAELREYPLVLWNCAAESDTTLTFEEREVIRQYADLGGKVVLLGQGILNDLDGQMGDPEVQDFVNNYLGIVLYILDSQFDFIVPDALVPYISPLTATSLDYSPLPDNLPLFSDPFIPGVDAFLFADGTAGSMPASADRFRPGPIHFQGFLMEAIPNAGVRANYLQYLMEWLGLEGDIIEDLMNDTGDFLQTEYCADSYIDWSSTENAFVFSSHGGITECETVWEYGVRPDLLCDWRMGFTHQVDTIGTISEMVLMELLGIQDVLRLSILEDVSLPGDYALRYYVECNGAVEVDTLLTNIGSTLIRRTHVMQATAPTSLDMKIMDVYGNIIHEVILPGCLLDFDGLRVRTVEIGTPLALPIEGWIDDYFFEGCLEFYATAVPETPAAGVNLSAYPNPFNPKTRIHYSQPRGGPVELAVYDLIGRRVKTLFAGNREAGEYSTDWDGTDASGRKLASGVYLLSLETSAGSEQRKLVLLK